MALTPKLLESNRAHGFKKGNIPWNNGTAKIVVKKPRVAWNKGLERSQETKDKIRAKLLGRKDSLEIRQKKSNSRKGALNPHWQGGKTKEGGRVRASLEYRLWRESVFKRDGFVCIIGGKSHGNKLHADHIKPFALYPELRLAIDNGRTLCEECHKATPTYLKSYLTKKDLE